MRYPTGHHPTGGRVTRISKPITAVYKVNRQDKTRQDLEPPSPRAGPARRTGDDPLDPTRSRSSSYSINTRNTQGCNQSQPNKQVSTESAQGRHITTGIPEPHRDINIRHFH